MKVFGAGPLEQWQHELRKVSRSGLVELVEELVFDLQYFGLKRDNDVLVKAVRRAKISGRSIDAHASFMRLVNDPKEIGRRVLKSEAAKKAARRRKRETKKEQRIREAWQEMDRRRSNESPSTEAACGAASAEPCSSSTSASVAQPANAQTTTNANAKGASVKSSARRASRPSGSRVAGHVKTER